MSYVGLVLPLRKDKTQVSFSAGFVKLISRENITPNQLQKYCHVLKEL